MTKHDKAEKPEQTGPAPEEKPPEAEEPVIAGPVEEATPMIEADKLENVENRYRRALADLANLHKRHARDRETLSQIVVSNFVKKLIPMVDNFAHSLKAAETATDVKAVVEAFKIVENQFYQILRESGIERIKSVGEKFDPEFYHAVQMVPTDEVEPGIVVEETAPGFHMREFVIRPAQVVVSAPTEPKPEK